MSLLRSKRDNVAYHIQPKYISTIIGTSLFQNSVPSFENGVDPDQLVSCQHPFTAVYKCMLYAGGK